MRKRSKDKNQKGLTQRMRSAGKGLRFSEGRITGLVKDGAPPLSITSTHVLQTNGLLMLPTVPQATWCPGPCTTSSRCTSRTPATAPRSTRRAPPRCTGSPKRSTPCATSCTAHRWSGRTPTLSPPRSPCRPRGEATSASVPL